MTRLVRSASSLRYSHEYRLAYDRGWRERNPDKIKEYKRRHREKFPDYGKTYHRPYHLKRKYGISGSEWDALFASQGYCCAICKRADPGKQNWHTDHAGPLPCTKESIRGILCCYCNHSVGAGNSDDLVRLRAAADYVEKWL